MPLLLIPVLLIAVAGLWALLLPLSLLQRYRHGKARRRAQPLAVRINAVMLVLSALLFLGGAWVSGHWVPGALLHAAAGLGAGMVLGMVGLWTTRFERTPQGLWYTPNPWLVLALTLLVLARIALGLWQVVQRWQAEVSVPLLLADHASVFALAGILLGYYTGYAQGLKRRLA